MKINPNAQIDHIMFPISMEFKEEVFKFASSHNQSVSDLIKHLLAKEIGYTYITSTLGGRQSRTPAEKAAASKEYHKNRNEELKNLRKALKS